MTGLHDVCVLLKLKLPPNPNPYSLAPPHPTRHCIEVPRVVDVIVGLRRRHAGCAGVMPEPMASTSIIGILWCLKRREEGNQRDVVVPGKQWDGRTRYLGMLLPPTLQ